MRRIPTLLACLVIVASLMMAGSAIAAGPTVSGSAELPAKQLAGPPEEFLNGSLSLPTPSQAGIRSRSAMIPINLQPAAAGGWGWNTELFIDNTEDFTLMAVSPEANAWQISVQQPGAAAALSLNAAAQEGSLGVSHQVGAIGLGQEGYPAEVFTFAEARPGRWQVQVAAADSASRVLAPNGYLVVASRSPYRLFSHLSTYDLVVGNRVGVAAYAYDDAGAEQANGQPAPLNGLVEEATLRLQLPNGQEVSLAMFDDGRHGDGAAEDGVFGALVKALQAGDYIAQVIVRGRTPAGQPFLRTSAHLFPVVQADLALTGQATATAQDAVRMRVELAAAAIGESNRSVYQVFAEVWGVDEQGASLPVAWIGGMVTAERAGDALVLPLSLDGRWIARAAARAPFQLRNVRVQDRDAHVPIAQADVIPLTVTSLPQATQDKVTEISAEMLMGPRPDREALAGVERAAGPTAGGKLMLVHGYCSDPMWPIADFTDYAVFSDAGQSRTHDYFARLIRDFGRQFPSFGVVAHSQGGAASTHLYTYYWSGLDNSSGQRLIQSVGTPYQGTALAGNLALLGEIFGFGCGKNTDLTYSGAALWLAGIPSWARSEVYYSTTSEDDVWWRWDFCNVATEPFLDDPEDGVVERWSGQLSGANNMGHRSGWCHITGMRDPAQYQDHTRNAEMNLYGNR